MKCDHCKREVKYTVNEKGKKYGGYSVPFNEDYCYDCWCEYIEIKNRHLKEINEWREKKCGDV